MILDTLRAALILGTILTNAMTLGAPLETTAKPNGNAVPDVTLLPSAESKPSLLPSVLPKLERVISPVAHVVKLGHGVASWYGKALERHRTASGEIFDSAGLTGASNSLPMGSRVKVTNLTNGRSVVVRINDRGILSPGRVIDLSRAAAEQIGLLRMGVAPVSLESAVAP